jgi:hypothetical protein
MAKIYAGIGSRSTPEDMLQIMKIIAHKLSFMGWTLRSGHADGADKAFEEGASLKEIYLPWAGFNGSKRSPNHIVTFGTDEQWQIAAQYHPDWAACSHGARLLHVRNVLQVLGPDCKTPATMVLCWTPGGKGGGGTGQAIRIANAYQIPVFDLAIEQGQHDLIEFVNSL